MTSLVSDHCAHRNKNRPDIRHQHFSVVNVTWLGVHNTTRRGSGNNHPLQKVHKRALHTTSRCNTGVWSDAIDLHHINRAEIQQDAAPELCSP